MMSEDAPSWQQEAWAHRHSTNPFAQFYPLFDLGYFPRGHGSIGDGTPIISGIAWGPVRLDADEFERTILATQAEYEARMGVKPTVIDLPNWARGTILEQIAFTNGFTIADRREEDGNHPG